MAKATLTSKGQITIPKDIRDALRIGTGDRVEFILTAESEALIKPATRSVDDVFGKLHQPGRGPVSIGEMDQQIKQRLKDRSG